MSEKVNKLPWSERVSIFSIHPDSASRDDVARLAAEHMALCDEVERLRKIRETWSGGFAEVYNIELMKQEELLPSFAYEILNHSDIRAFCYEVCKQIVLEQALKEEES